MKTTNETSHTQGEFRAYHYHGQDSTVATDNGNKRLADNITNSADATLFAAAPEMLAALETLIDANKNPIGWDWDRARAAIAKAKGQL